MQIFASNIGADGNILAAFTLSPSLDLKLVVMNENKQGKKIDYFQVSTLLARNVKLRLHGYWPGSSQP